MLRYLALIYVLWFLSDCPKKEQKPNRNFGGYKKTAKTARAQIRNLITDMEPEEKEKLYEDFVGKGF